MAIKQITAPELAEQLAGTHALLLLDVRENFEYNYARIAGSMLMPLAQIPARLAELNPNQETVVICHHGMRSQQAAFFLEQNGFGKVSNLVGGIDAWSRLCDSSVPRY